MAAQKNIILIYTGGTIGMVKDYNSDSLKAFDFNQLMDNIPELQQLDCSIQAISFDTPIDSSNMSPRHWAKIAQIIEENYNQNDGFVVLHGSDTMSYSASALSFMLEDLNKPVIFTGSQLPVGDLRTDAKENLITAIQLAGLYDGGKAVIQEVGLYFEYKLYRGNRTTKINAEHFQAFASPNHPPLAQSGVHLKINHPYLRRNTRRKNNLTVHKRMDANVGLLKLFPGISKAFIESVLATPDLKALILETYGAGNASTEEWFLKLIEKAINNGLLIINVTQCSGGSIAMGHYETSQQLKSLGLINGKDITTEAAVTKAMYLLGDGVSETSFKTIFETSIRGEMSQN